MNGISRVIEAKGLDALRCSVEAEGTLVNVTVGNHREPDVGIP